MRHCIDMLWKMILRINLAKSSIPKSVTKLWEITTMDSRTRSPILWLESNLIHELYKHVTWLSQLMFPENNSSESKNNINMVIFFISQIFLVQEKFTSDTTVFWHWNCVLCIMTLELLYYSIWLARFWFLIMYSCILVFQFYAAVISISI